MIFFRKKEQKKAVVVTGFNIETHTGGIETFNQYLKDILRDYGYNVLFVYAEDFQNELHIYNEWLGRVYQAGQYAEKLSFNRDDIVILNGYYGGGFIDKKVKTYTVFHSVHPYYAEAVRKFVPDATYWELRHVVGDIFEKNAIKGSDAIIAVSESVKDQLIEYYELPPQKIFKINNPVNTDVFKPLPAKDVLEIKKKYDFGERKIGLFVGRWEEAKGTKLFEDVINENQDILWIIVGCSGGGNPLCNGNIIYLKDIDKKELNKIYNIVDFLFFPSYYEGFGLVAAEALSCGCPVVGRSEGFLSDIELAKYIIDRGFFLNIEDGDKKILPQKKIRGIIDKLIKKNYTHYEKKLMSNFIKKNLSIRVWDKKLQRIF